jgi:hypothetical protein
MPAKPSRAVIWRSVHTVVQHPLAAIVVGLLVVVAALEQVVGQAGQARTWIGSEGQLGLIVLGIYQVLLGLGYLLIGVRFMGFGVLGAEQGRCNKELTAICRFVNNPVVALAVGIIIMLGGTVAIIRQASAGLSGSPPVAWQTGVIALGLYTTACNLGNALVGLEIFDTVETEKSWLGRLCHRIEHIARRPWVDLVLAALIISLGIWYSLQVDPLHARGSLLGLMLMAGYQLLRTLPMMFMGVILADDGLSPAASPIAGDAGS